MDFKKDYYKILEVQDTATELEIKMAYRRLAMQYHPDRNPGDLFFEEKTKDINEAKDVLLNANKRFVYDEYRKSVLEEERARTSAAPKAEKRRQKPSDEDADTVTAPSKKKRYQRKRTVETIVKHYFTGTIAIKYFAPFDTEKEDAHLREFYYRINFTDVLLEIQSTDIQISEKPPERYANMFANYPVTDIPVLQPVKAIVIDGDQSKAYLLYINDLRITDPQITLVTKHESTSFGTIVSPVFGYIKESSYHEIIEEVEESSGPTGRQEAKVEDDVQYQRKEYYYYNGSTYWGNWERQTPYYQQFTTRPTSTWTRKTQTAAGGCASPTVSLVFIIAYFVFLLLAIPAIWPALCFLLIMYLLGTLFKWIIGPNVRMVSWFSTMFVILFFASLLNHCSVPGKKHPPLAAINETPKEREKARSTPIRSYDPAKRDTLITRFRSWTDYDKNIYSGSYSIRSSEVASAALFKNDISYAVNTNNSYDHMVYDLKNHDSTALNGLYMLFDTIRTSRHLPADKFAEVIVSFVQDIPYSLVLDKDCDPLQYNIPSVREYLLRPDAICEPYQRFGINTPVEFLATLKGDCDTRALFLYHVLAHYGYDVIMLTSDVYNHSVIGVHLPYAGTAYTYAATTYVLWETTSPGFRPGFIPSEISDLNYWRISLKSK